MTRTRRESKRLTLLFAALIVFFLLVTARLAQLQIVNAPRYSQIVEKQSGGRISIPAERGNIYDRYGRLVAGNVYRQSLYAYANNAAELDRIHKYLDRYYGYKKGKAKEKFDLEVRRFAYIDRTVSDEAAWRIAREAPRGLYLRTESDRRYPYGTVGKQILGFTSIDNAGLSGFEFSYDSLLAGRPGYADIRRDGLQNVIRVKEQALVATVPGTSVVLTVDWRLQEIVEQELRRAVEMQNAVSGKAVFLDCQSGDILAIAHYDPEEDPERPVKLRAIADQFEPGSVLKAFTAAGLLDAGVVDFDDSTWCEKGKWKVGRRILHDDKELGNLTFRGIVEYSSNIGIAKWALRIGGDELHQTFRRFGLGERLACGLPGENQGSVATYKKWSDYLVSALAMGHSVASNSLQIASGFAAIANGGELLRPHVLLGYVGADGRVVTQREREVIRRAMKSGSVDSLQAMLRGVVEHGTAKAVNSDVIAIAGKTGTAEVVRPDGRGYIKNRFTASFAGFFPAEAPIIAGIVVLDQPRRITYGGLTSGPAFRSIAERYVVANPDLFQDSTQILFAENGRSTDAVRTPDLIGKSVGQANRTTEQRGLAFRCSAETGKVIWQFPPPDRPVLKGDAIIAVIRNDSGAVPMIDFTGLPVRKAVAALAAAGVQTEVIGRGTVIEQSIAPGATLGEDMICRLVCKPG